MFAFSTLCMALIGVCIAVPLESPSSDQASPMLVEQEPLPDIQLADQSEQISNLEPLNMELEPSNVEEYFDPRIIGGTDAPETKYMVALVIGWHVKSFICGASIITPRHLLTAAHCIYTNWMDGGLMESYHGIVGTNTWNQGGSEVKLLSHLDHPEYNFVTMKYDCSVIKTVDIILFNHRVQPICMESKWVGGGALCHATGWGAQQVWGGAADVLQILSLRTISEEECRRLMRDVVGQNHAPIDYKLEICGFHSRGHGMCFGDSGSALVKDNCLIGIVSWGSPCANGAPDIYGRVSAMWKFIEFAMKHNVNVTLST